MKSVDDLVLPFCACGRTWSQCDGSRAGCRKAPRWPYAARTNDEIAAECANDEIDEAWRRAKPTHDELVAALRQFCADHEASGMACEGLNAAYIEAAALLRRDDLAR